ncbi:MAG: efflux RND transporter periplasmic adaptor subunit [Deltaproteobacteria bacterium]
MITSRLRANATLALVLLSALPVACGRAAPQVQIASAPPPCRCMPEPAPGSSAMPPDARAPAAPRPVVREERVGRQSMTRVVRAPVTIDVAARADVTSPVSGVVQVLNVDLTTRVRRGEVMAVVHPTGAPPGRDVTIRAPLDGDVLSRAVNLGTPVEAARTLLYTVGDLARLVARAEVPELEMSRLHVGQRARLSFQTLPGMAFDGVVALVVPAVGAAHTRQVHIPLGDPERRLLPGMTGLVSIEVEAHADALVVPSDAVARRGTRAVVYVARDGLAHERVVSTGIGTDSSVEIIEGLREDESVLAPAEGLSDGARVELPAVR